MTIYEVVFTADGRRVRDGLPAHDEEEARELAAAMIPAGATGVLVITGEHSTDEVSVSGSGPGAELEGVPDPEPQQQAPAEPDPGTEADTVPDAKAGPGLVPFRAPGSLESLEYDDLVVLGQNLNSASRWLLGDLAAQVGRKYGEGRLEQFAEDIDVEYATLRGYKAVSQAYPGETVLRSTNPWSVYRILLGQEDRLELVAAEDGMTAAAARQLVGDRKPKPPAPVASAPAEQPQHQGDDDSPPPAADGDTGQAGTTEVPVLPGDVVQAPARKNQESYLLAWRRLEHLMAAPGGLWRTRGNARRKNPPPMPPVENIDALIAVLRILRAGGADPGPDTGPAAPGAGVAALDEAGVLDARSGLAPCARAGRMRQQREPSRCRVHRRNHPGRRAQLRSACALTDAQAREAHDAPGSPCLYRGCGPV